MSSQLIPPSVTLLSFISLKLQNLLGFLSDTKSLKNAFSDDGIDNADSKTLLSDPDVLAFFQLLSLAILCSNFHHASATVLHFDHHDNDIQIAWKDNIHTPFHFGKNDRHFSYFKKKLMTSVFNFPKLLLWSQKGLDHALNFLLSENKTLDKSMDMVSDILSQRSRLSDYLDYASDENIFLLISALPNTKLNELYRHIQQDIPKDLSVDISANKKLNLVSFFEQNTVDAQYSLEKMKLHFNLFFFSDTGYFQEKFHSHCVSKLKDFFKDPKVVDTTLHHLNLTSSGQIRVQQELYSIFITHLSRTIQ